VWADCTQIEDRDSLVSWSVAHRNAGLNPFQFAAPTLPSFAQAHQGQFEDVTWAANNEPPQPNYHTVQHGNSDEGWMSGPGVDWDGRVNYDAFANAFNNDVDMAPMIRNIDEPDKWFYFGLAGALEDAWGGHKGDWRKCKTDPGLREEVVEFLDSLELPAQYLEPMPNSTECQFLKYYKITWKVNLATGTQAQQAVGWKGYLTFSAGE